MKVTVKRIFGKLTDQDGRCIHYSSELDIIANKCGFCGKFYACYKCHNELEDHEFAAVNPDEAETVMCGVCGEKYSYKVYSALEKCTGCGKSFNPGCANHCSIYSL